MRRTFYLLISFLIIFTSLTGCSDKVISLPEANYTVDIQSESFVDLFNSVTIQYPVIISDTINNVTEINNELYEYVKNQYRRQGLASDEEESYNYEITDVEITLATLNFVSIVILGQYIGNESTHLEYISYSINYDLLNCEMIGIQSFLNDFSAIKDLFLDNEFEFDFGDETQVSSISPSDLMLPYRSEYGIYPFIYFREGYMCLLLELSHVAGGYTGFKINILNVEDYLQNNEICLFLTTDVDS